MQLVAEVLAVGTAALRLPGALRRSGCTTRRRGRGGDHWPVVLVHGYAGSEVVWDPLLRVLAVDGFDSVTVSYDSFGVQVPDVTACIAEVVRETSAAGRGVHLVGHSLGGLLVRRAIADHRLADRVGAAVTIATPHGGSPFARFAVGHCARLMLPGAACAQQAGDVPAAVAGPRWLSFASDSDRVVPPASARLTDPALGARNVLVRGRGHLTICRDPHLLRTLVDHLHGAETPAVPPALALAA